MEPARIEMSTKQIFRLWWRAAALVLSYSTPAFCQTYIFGRADFPTGVGPESAIVADFNADGKPDLAVVNSGDNTVTIRLGNGDGTFGARADYATGRGPVSVVTGDFNGDGKLDLAVANGSDSTVSILVGNGDGTFRVAGVLPTRNPPHRVIVADFNGDGKLDIATVNTTSVTTSANNSVSVFLGRGDATFAAPNEYPMDGATFAIAASDFNGDGKLDLAIGNTGLAAVSILLGNGDGTFQTPPINTASGIANFVSTFLIARDFDGNGTPDIASVGGGKVSILLGNGDGTFQPHVDYPVAGPDAGWLTADDFNGDGKLDLAVANGFSGGPPVPSVSILLGKGDGTFLTAVDYGTGSQPYSVSSADVNGDRKADLIMATAANSVAVLIGRGDGTFSKSTDYLAGAVPFGLTTGDFNGDGRLDLAVANRADNTVSVLLSSGNGSFALAQPYPAGLVPRAVVAGDLNGDGRDDLVVADPSCSIIFPPCPTTGSVSVLIANSDGTLRAPVPYAVNGYPVAVAMGDFNRDGKLDVVVANGNSPGTVSVLLGTGDGNLQAPVAYSTAANPQAVTVGDFNGDGIQDLAVATAGSSAVSILLGHGDGTFSPHVDYAVGNGAISIAAGDFNQDGKLDLAVANNSDNTISILLGTGDGSFQNPTTYHPGHLTLTAVAVGDFNGDGKPDLAVVNNFDNAITLLLGKGDGTFPTVVDYQYSTGGSSFGITAADLRRAGLSDLAVANFEGGAGNTLSILLNSPMAALFPGKLSFSTETIGLSSSPQPIQLSNPGAGPLAITNIAATGEFTQSADCGSVLGVGASCTINVVFAPVAAGVRAGGLTITDNATNNPQTILLSGRGAGPAIHLSPSTVTFASQLLTTTSAAQTINLSNPGDSALMIASITTSGDFAQTNDCGNAIAPDTGCSINVTFSPGAIGSRTGALNISDNVPGGPHSVTLSGTGTDFSIGPAAGSSLSANVKAGGSATYTLNVDSLGGLNGMVSFTCSGAPSEAVCSVSPSSVTLNGSSSASTTVTVTTTAPSVVSLRRVPILPDGNVRIVRGQVRPLALVAIWCGAVILIRRAGRWKSWRTLGMTGVMLALMCASCGGGSSSPVTHNLGTPTGSYSISVTASVTTGTTTVQHEAKLTLIVN